MKTFRISSQEGFILERPFLREYRDGNKYYLEVKGDDLELMDEYHTMHELYEHRMALNIALFNQWGKSSMFFDIDKLNADWGKVLIPKVMKSKLHHDGTMFEGYFIVMAITQFGQISYHYKLKHWDKFRIPEVERTPEWDGHNSIQVMERLMSL